MAQESKPTNRGSRTKTFALDEVTATRIEALAVATGQSESAIANRILEAGSRQMLLERDYEGTEDSLRGPMSFADVRGVLPADTITDEELRALRTSSLDRVRQGNSTLVNPAPDERHRL